MKTPDPTDRVVEKALCAGFAPGPETRSAVSSSGGLGVVEGAQWPPSPAPELGPEGQRRTSLDGGGSPALGAASGP